MTERPGNYVLGYFLGLGAGLRGLFGSLSGGPSGVLGETVIDYFEAC